MRKFKLIKKYPGFESLDTVYEHSGKGDRPHKYTWVKNSCSYTYDLDNFPEYWEEIIKKPEYVKCIKVTQMGVSSYILNTIYKLSENSDYVGTGMAKWDNTNNSKFEPSTKEAYDLQELKAKFLVDKWYSITTKPRDTVYKNIRFKVGSIENTLVTYKYNNYIDHNNIYGHGNGMEFKNIIDVKELSVESNEIQPYLPDNHVDKVKPKLDYEILSFTSRWHTTEICIKYDNGRFGRNWGDKTVEEMLTEVSNNFRKIHSIKRLSDGEIFTVGDKVEVYGMSYNITGFTTGMYNDNLFRITVNTNTNYLLKNVNKSVIKPVLFTTHDGVDITDRNRIIYYCTKNGEFCKDKDDPTDVCYKIAPFNNTNYVWFSNKTSCQEYIDKVYKQNVKVEELITVQLTKEKYDLLMQLLEE